ncbi:hypothetical protein HYV74_05165 [Candidatus Uhrbacteria bacterium]|nr:hypothetical protein [Candidatus Uhrbacteria bacterium]
MFIAILFIGIGIIFLLRNLGLISMQWELIWPILLIGAGIYIAIISRRMEKWWDRVWNRIIGRFR